jgi:hypothetical protein
MFFGMEASSGTKVSCSCFGFGIRELLRPGSRNHPTLYGRFQSIPAQWHPKGHWDNAVAWEL